jgi:hypothetical protein
MDSIPIRHIAQNQQIITANTLSQYSKHTNSF